MIIFFIAALAETNRAPFDLAEAESELVAGFHTEYSGLRWSFFFMAEYGSMFTVSGLAAILFFGGWHGPIPVFEILGATSADSVWVQFLVNLAGMTNFIGKACVGVSVMMWVRWTLPRLRIDQVMTTCLKYCVPIAAVCFIGATFWQFYDVPFLNDVAPSRARGQVRESWVVQVPAASSRPTDTTAITPRGIEIAGPKLPASWDPSQPNLIADDHSIANDHKVDRPAQARIVTDHVGARHSPLTDRGSSPVSTSDLITIEVGGDS